MPRARRLTHARFALTHMRTRLAAQLPNTKSHRIQLTERARRITHGASSQIAQHGKCSHRCHRNWNCSTRSAPLNAAMRLLLTSAAILSAIPADQDGTTVGYHHGRGCSANCRAKCATKADLTGIPHFKAHVQEIPFIFQRIYRVTKYNEMLECFLSFNKENSSNEKSIGFTVGYSHLRPGVDRRSVHNR